MVKRDTHTKRAKERERGEKERKKDSFVVERDIEMISMINTSTYDIIYMIHNIKNSMTSSIDLWSNGKMVYL